MAEVNIIRKHLEGWVGDAWLVEREGEYFVVSGVHALLTGWEVLVFAADKDGEVACLHEVAGGKGITYEEAIAELAEKGLS